MKKLFGILLLITLVSCGHVMVSTFGPKGYRYRDLAGDFHGLGTEFSYPPAPYPSPSDISKYNSGDYNSISFTYNCLNGEYVKISYSLHVYLWTISDIYKASGICNK